MLTTVIFAELYCVTDIFHALIEDELNERSTQRCEPCEQYISSYSIPQ